MRTHDYGQYGQTLLKPNLYAYLQLVPNSFGNKNDKLRDHHQSTVVGNAHAQDALRMRSFYPDHTLDRK